MRSGRVSTDAALCRGVVAAVVWLVMANTPVAGQPLDVDQSGPPVDAFTDLVYVTRRLFGLAPVPPSFRQLDPEIPSDPVIAARVDLLGAALDVDANQDVDPFTDLVYCARDLFGLPAVPASFRTLDPDIPSDAVIATRCRALAASATPTPTATVAPATPTPSRTISATPTTMPTSTPTIAPTPTTTASPTSTPTTVPTFTATAAPTVTATTAPTSMATAAPTVTPTAAPMSTATVAPTSTPTAMPTVTLTSTPAPTHTATATGSATPSPGDPCAASIELAPGTVFPVQGTTEAKTDDAKQATCGSGGNGAPDEIYEYLAPVKGLYDVTVSSHAFVPLVSLRRGGCDQPQSACVLDGLAPDALNGAVRFDAVSLEAGERLAVVVDGEGSDSGSFELTVHRRRPELVVSDVAIMQPAPYAAGGLITVRATVRNPGDGDAGPTTLRFGVYRDTAGQYPTSDVEVICALPDGVPAGAVMPCGADTQLVLPAVAAGTYVLAARVDADVDEVNPGNNVSSLPFDLVVRGAAFVEKAFRAADGTVYQVLVAQPQTTATRADRFEVTTVALGAAGTLRTCLQSPSASGATLMAAVGAPAVLPRSGLRRTIRLRPTDLSDLVQAFDFDDKAGGRLIIGTGPTPINVCDRPGTCTGTPMPLLPFTTATADVPAACEAVAPSGSFCSGAGAKYTLAFGLTASAGTCSSPSATHTSARVCEPTLGTGLALLPGEAIVLVWRPGRADVDVQASALGITSDDEGVATQCVSNQFVTATLASPENLPATPLLSFVTAVRGETDPLPVAASPDGANVYTGGNGVVASYRREANGSLTKIDEERQGEFSVLGIRNVFAMALSPDGAHVYTVGRGDNSVTVFARTTNRQDANFGKLSFAQTVIDGEAGTTGLGLPLGIAIDAQGTHVYVVGDDAIAVFARDAVSVSPGFGRLDPVPVQVIRDGLTRRAAVALSPDGAHAYVSGDNGLAVFARDASSGQLTLLQVLRDNQAGVDGLGGSNQIAVAPQGEHVYVTSSEDDGVAQFTRNADPASANFGRLTYVEVLRNGVRGVQGLDYASAVALSPNGDYLYALGLVSHAVAVFSRAPATGQLTFKIAPSDDLRYPEAIALDPEGKNIYVSGRFGNGLASFSRDATSGVPSLLEIERLGVGGLDDVAGLVVSGDGKHLYAAGNNDDAVVGFARDAVTGRLTVVDTQKSENGVDGLISPRGLALSSNGKHLYVASQGDVVHDVGAATVFSRDANTGRLTFVEAERFRTRGAYDVVVSSDGGTVYVSALGENRITLFGRDSTSGSLGFLLSASFSDGGPTALALNPFASRLFVARRFFFDVDVYPANLTPRLYRASDSLSDEAADLALDPSGTHLYVVKPNVNALSVYSVPSSASSATLVETKRDGTGGVSGIKGAYVVAVSPTPGAYVLTGGIDNDSLAAFTRDPATGKLSFVEAHYDGQNGVDGLAFPQDIVFSPDGRHVYVAGGNDNAIAIFAVND